MEFLIELLFELLLQIFGDAILDGLMRSRSPVASTVGNSMAACLFALILAGISLVIFPGHLIEDKELRIAALIVLPIVNGILMAMIGRHLIRIGRKRSGYEHFFPAFAFSFVFGAIRFSAAR